MAEPCAHPQADQIRRVALTALAMGCVVMLLKFGVFLLTNSAAVLSDALESIINIIAACVMLYSIWLSNQPADSDHPYGHGKIEFLTLGFEGLMILLAGGGIAYVAGQRFFSPAPVKADLGTGLLVGVNIVNASLAGYVYWSGRRYHSAVLIADAQHLATDVATTCGVVLGLLLVWIFQVAWLDPLIALVLAVLILFTAWKLLVQSVDGLMDRNDAKDQNIIAGILDEEVRAGHIRGYHKVRHRHTGPFTWIDLHLQVDPEMSVRAGHNLASRVEYRIEQRFGQAAKATAHVEPAEEPSSPPLPSAAPPPNPPRNPD